MVDFMTIYNNLEFLGDSLRLQYSNFIFRHQKDSEIDLESIIKRLKKDEPIEYILNVAEFYGIDFYVDNRVLIPRVETEDLVTQTLNFIDQFKNISFTVMDIGTGSGCVAIALALNLHSRMQIKFVAIEKEKNALEVAKRNIIYYKLESIIELIHADFREINFNEYRNLIICANLPYLSSTQKLPRSVIDYEPPTALFGGKHGNELINALKQQIKDLQNVCFAIFETQNGVIDCFIKRNPYN